MSDHYNYSQKFKLRQTVYKWWCVIYKPVYKLFHHGEWPKEKEPYYVCGQDNFDKRQEEQQKLAEEITRTLANRGQNEVDVIIQSAEITETKPSNSTVNNQDANEEIDTSNIDNDVLARANEIMERLAREAADDEAKKQKEIDEARRKAEEKAKLDSIMDANKVDISQYIEQGKHNQLLASEGHIDNE